MKPFSFFVRNEAFEITILEINTYCLFNIYLDRIANKRDWKEWHIGIGFLFFKYGKTWQKLGKNEWHEWDFFYTPWSDYD